MDRSLTREELKNYLPHREPMLLVDDVALEGEICTGHYKVRGDEFFLQGHFPGYPVVPGVVLCEIMGQCTCALLLEELPGRLTFYAGLDNVRFKNQVRPGDLITVTSHITNRRGLTFFIDAEARVDGKLCAKGSLIFMLADKPE
ncbi:MAG: beta-hydroxyacyl-ACP dehydratase [Bacteroidales bacterium]|jgi:3-hydroxyacyl-[acyl-carrier-protein] dehydratase|nr:beta-hydroxyacyl-ACP dehydratase [Bacteroidales bacterium]MBQ1707841.1 beta-hydroxyacyl-ACP dehydratase [Bacteroidales bacterium]MBQ4013093.1 beta-hydroxyacyl-ACP dehydratase [Bacteroidales bacterium]